ncbi:flagellar biosynthetic protein FliO [Rhizobium halophilum]|uniref:flagellar biosynthetic protein FliO n=1 Tax=Rhizobium halophilum TaxID=2846852 RepID=UPI001EFED6EF|nr:flagellar biosynthetic protein FliO [Rhizobium halophilum]MCF6368449.1 flagellar biosynthetic protein FliO [Rhizobium halophilum]
MSDYGGRLLVAILGVGVGFLCLIGVLWLLRERRAPSPFIRGGRNRQPRLQVLDAAAVDTRRRLVLVRRDDVEHLIMIGGPTDIVIEAGIPGLVKTETAAPREATESPRPERNRPQEHRSPRPQARTDVASSATRAAPARPQPDRDEAPPIPALSAEGFSRRSEGASPLPFPVVPPSAINAGPGPATMPPPTAPMPISPHEQEIRREPILEGAADILDAARSRVFQGPSEPVPSAPPAAVAERGSRPLGSEFERVLEEEMAHNLASREPTSRSVSRELDPEGSSPQRDPERSRLTGATPDPSLQNEMARIFGEMSVTRDR